jgi:ABC-type glycerol-3-phosphate transport system permease component
MKHHHNERTSTWFIILVHAVLIFFAFLCLFFFVILIINATRSHVDIQKGFSIIPGSSFMKKPDQCFKRCKHPGTFRHQKQPDRIRRRGGSGDLFLRSDCLRPLCV